MTDNIKSKLLLEWHALISKCAREHGSEYCYMPIKDWYDTLTNNEKNTFDEILLENISNNYAIGTAMYIRSNRIRNSLIEILKNAIEEDDYTFIKSEYLTLLTSYPCTAEVKNILVCFINQDKNELLQVVALQVMSRIIPELALEFISKVKSFYKYKGNSYLCLIYGSLLDHFKEGFPQKLASVARYLTEEELNKILENIPIILPSEKWKDKGEKIISELEKIFNTKIDRQLKL